MQRAGSGETRIGFAQSRSPGQAIRHILETQPFSGPKPGPPGSTQLGKKPVTMVRASTQAGMVSTYRTRPPSATAGDKCLRRTRGLEGRWDGGMVGTVQ